MLHPPTVVLLWGALSLPAAAAAGEAHGNQPEPGAAVAAKLDVDSLARAAAPFDLAEVSRVSLFATPEAAVSPTTAIRTSSAPRALAPFRSLSETVPQQPFERAQAGCTDTCNFAGDGECDDGGSGAEFSECSIGTDCSDCGTSDNEAVATFNDHFSVGLYAWLIISGLWWCWACCAPIADETEVDSELQERITQAVKVEKVSQLWPSRRALQKVNKLDQWMTWGKVWCIYTRWTMIMVNAILISWYFTMVVKECPNQEVNFELGNEKDKALTVEFAMSDLNISYCGQSWGTTALNTTCAYVLDGDCDDGGLGSAYSYCSCGTDLDDCNFRGPSSDECNPKAIFDAYRENNSMRRTLLKIALHVTGVLFIFVKMYGLREKGKRQGHLYASEHYPKLVNFLDGCMSGDGANLLLALFTEVEWNSETRVYTIHFDTFEYVFVFLLGIVGVVFMLELLVLFVESMIEDESDNAHGKSSKVTACLLTGLGIVMVYSAFMTIKKALDQTDNLYNHGSLDAPEDENDDTDEPEDSAWDQFIHAYFGIAKDVKGPLKFMFDIMNAAAILNTCLEKIGWLFGRKFMTDRFQSLEGFSGGDSILTMCGECMGADGNPLKEMKDTKDHANKMMEMGSTVTQLFTQKV